MANLLQLYKNGVDGKIELKVDPLSITKFDVSDSLKILADLSLLYPESTSSWTYAKDMIVRDSSYRLFISLADDVSGDTTIGANWQLVSSTSGNKQVYDVAATGFANEYIAINTSITSYSTENIIIVTPDVPNDDEVLFEINVLGQLPVLKFSSGAFVPLGAGDFAGTLLLLYRTTYFLVVGGPVSGGGSTGVTLSILCDGSTEIYPLEHGQGTRNLVITACAGQSPYNVYWPNIELVDIDNANVDLSAYSFPNGFILNVTFK